MKAALPRDVSLNILFVIDICKLTLEEISWILFYIS